MTKKINSSSGFVQLLIASAILLADRLSKIQIQRSLQEFDAIPVIPGWLRIIHAENPGAAFSLFAEGNPLVRGFVLLGVSSAVLLFVVWALWSERSKLNSGLSRFALSLILGGAAGNLYDRLVRHTVTDFIEVYHGAWSFPAFNVADSAITVGAILLLFDLWRQDPKTYGESERIDREYSPVKRR